MSKPTIGHYDVEIPVGDDLALPVRFSFSLTNQQVFWTVRKTESTSGELVYQSPAITSFTTDQNTDDTVTLAAPWSSLPTDVQAGADYFWSLQITNATGAEKTYLKGRFRILNHAGRINPA